MITKQNLLDRMAKEGACWSATRYVREHKSNDAQVIWSTCDVLDWLEWLICYVSPKEARRYIKRCVERAPLHKDDEALYIMNIESNAGRCLYTAAYAAKWGMFELSEEQRETECKARLTYLQSWQFSSKHKDNV